MDQKLNDTWNYFKPFRFSENSSKIENRGGSEILEKKSYIVQFFSDLEMDSTQLFGRPIASYLEAKMIWYPPH